ncbi:hypothetical protein [Rhodococcus pyridinivorans]|uniref:hypothetical protein n=1 Tax=Rhodococcus pyridinivorans TaxID=103816 RepID=UPI00110E37D9|nr:hypothetical protein [Rhodococcus pyridinivorans]
MEYSNGEWPMTVWQASINSAEDELQRAVSSSLELSEALMEAARLISDLSHERFDEGDVPGEDVCLMASRVEREVTDFAMRVMADISRAIDDARDIGPRAHDQIVNY